MRTPHSLPQSRVSRRAFSMVELLVATAIMGVLAALLMSGLSGLTNKGKKAKCVSNLRQIGVGLMTYAAENNGDLPWATVKPNTDLGQSLGLSADYMWSKQVGPYLPQRGQSLTAQQNEVFVCPSARFTGYSTKTISSTYNSSSTLFYFTSSSSLGAAGADLSTPKRKLASVENPTRTILVAEGKQSAGGGACASSVRWDQALADLQSASPNQTLYLDYRHDGTMNVAYADGHVGSVSFKDRADIIRAMWEGRNY